MIVNPAEMRGIEEALFRGGILAETLMDAVGRRIAQRIDLLIGSRAAKVVFYVGKGNNAGDVLVAAHLLNGLVAESGKKVQTFLRLALGDPGELGEMPGKKFASLSTDRISVLSASQMRDLTVASTEKLVVVDGLLGIGASGGLRDPIRSAAGEINALRRGRGAYVLSVDVPTGLDAATGNADANAVVADETLTVGFAKIGLVADQAANYVGKLEIISLPEFSRAHEQAPGAVARGGLITSDKVGSLLPPRPHESNKGMFGRIGILAGSVGATGAAVMCSHACARAGAGLITLLTDPAIYPIVAGAASPEVMVKPLPSLLEVLDMDFDVLGLGPGLGRQNGGAVRELITRWPKPMVVDADGLNALSEGMAALEKPAGARLLTPHPGEMKRLLKGDDRLRALAEDKHAPRAVVAREFTDRYPVTLLVKGARTIIAERGKPMAYNTTGNSGMATGGMGDVLTGVCCALAGQDLSLYDSACCGAWLHGRAADLAREEGESEQSLIPLDLLARMGRAFLTTRRGV